MKKDDSLLNAAQEFLVESINNYQRKRLNFSIMHAVTATELLLKERLSRIHHVLVYRNVDSTNIKDQLTVRLSDLPQRLVNFGITIDPSELSLISKVAKWRNQIVHHMPDYSHNEATAYLGELYNFVAKFLRTELKVNFRSILPKHLFRTVNGLTKEWEAIVGEARESAKNEGNVLKISCPNCNATETICYREKNSAIYCHLCEETREYRECADCGRMDMGTSFDYLGEETFHCDRCQRERDEAAADQYAEMLSDIARGK